MDRLPSVPRVTVSPLRSQLLYLHRPSNVMFSVPIQNLPPIPQSRLPGYLMSPRHELLSSDCPSTAEKKPRALDFTQRLERKLTEYNTSQNVLKRWLFEILSWFISALCKAAIVAIYVNLKDKPISQSRSSMLLTMANVLGKVASAALIVPTSEALGQLKWNWFHDSKAMWDFEIFDKATRGPWGALMLLFRTRGRSLAALGALLIVILLAIDTFFQQVIELPERWSLEDAVSKLPVTVRYKSDAGAVYNGWIPIATKDPDLFQLIEKFSYGNGTKPVPFGNGTRPDIPLVGVTFLSEYTTKKIHRLAHGALSILHDGRDYHLDAYHANKITQSCPTSRCTWPLYETLGVCSQCADVSNYLTYDCITSRIDWTANLTGGFDATGSYPNATMCGYFLNSTDANPILMSGFLIESNNTRRGEALVMRTLPLTTLLTREPLFGNGLIHFKHLRNTLTDVLIVSAVNGSADTVFKMIPPVAQECVLSWCVKTIKSSYDHGAYSEEIIQTYDNTTAGDFPWLGVPFVDEYGAGTDICYLQDINIAGTTSDQRNFSGYGTDNVTTLSVVQGFIDIFPAFTTTNDTFVRPVMRSKTYAEGLAYNRLLDFNPWLAPNNVSRHMERLATAMTNVIRSAPSNTMFTGRAFSLETYVAVHWEWLSFPFILLLLSLVFLLSTMRKTSKESGIGIWKTSAMPTLIYGLPQDVREGLPSSEANDRAYRKGARKVRIRLLPDQGWRVSGQLCASPSFLPRTQYRERAGLV
jgi:hypothetical protein